MRFLDKAFRCLLAASVVLATLPTGARATDVDYVVEPWAFNIGGGYSTPTGGINSMLTDGWNFTIGTGYNFSEQAGLMLAWLVVPMLHALLGWESRRIERCADRLTIDAGLGPQLLEAIDFLSVVESHRPTSGLFSVLGLPGCTLVDRARHIRRLLAPQPTA